MLLKSLSLVAIFGIGLGLNFEPLEKAHGAYGRTTPMTIWVAQDRRRVLFRIQKQNTMRESKTNT